MTKQHSPRIRCTEHYPEVGNTRKRHTADFLGISDSTLNRWVKAKKLPQPFELEGGLYVFDAAEIRAWVDNKKVQRIS